MIKLIKSTFYNEDKTKERLCGFISSAKRLSIGEKCLEFEKEFADFQGRKYCILFNSGSSANLALLQALLNLGLVKKGDKIAFSAVTWATNVMPIIQLGLEPCPVDVEIETLNSSSRNLTEALGKNSRIRAFFITNLLGFCSDIDKIKSVCEEKNILLLEDNCESLGTIHKGTRLGNFGLASTYSFYVGHHLSTIEGGAVCTDDEDLYAMLAMVRAHGWDRDLPQSLHAKVRAKEGPTDEFYTLYTFYTLGYNLRPTEITGFLGLEQLQYIDEILNKRNLNFLKFFSAAKDNFDFYGLAFTHIDFVSNFAYPVICKTPEIFRSYLRRFNEAEMEIRPIVGGDMTGQSFYRKLFGDGQRLPNASLIHNQGFYFGNNPDLTSEEIALISKLLQKEPSKASEILEPRPKMVTSLVDSPPA